MSVGGRSLGAHRIAWELRNGPVPDGMVVDHLCRVRRCVNAAHLRVVTQKENVKRTPGSLRSTGNALILRVRAQTILAQESCIGAKTWSVLFMENEIEIRSTGSTAQKRK